MHLNQFDDDALREASADQREMVRLVRLARAEMSKRLVDIGCMNPGEMGELFTALDQLIDLHIYAHSMDDRLESTKERYQRAGWGD